MRNESLFLFRTYFENFSKKFISQDPDKSFAYKLKYNHTIRVCKIICDIGCHEALENNNLLIAETAALFHDIGRFKQFFEYGTFDDKKSVDHSKLSLEIIYRNNIIKELHPKEQELIRKVIESHNKKILPDNLSKAQNFLSRLLRDADKIDIFNIVLDHYKQMKESGNIEVHLGLPDSEGYTKDNINDLLNNRIVSYENINNLNDFKLLQVGMIFDLNFSRTFQIFKQRDYINSLFSFLPFNPDINKIKEIVMSFVEYRANKFVE